MCVDTQPTLLANNCWPTHTHTQQEILAEFAAPPAISPDTAAYLSERTRRLTLQVSTPAADTTTPITTSTDHTHSISSTSPRLKLVVEDSPPTSPTETAQHDHQTTKLSFDAPDFQSTPQVATPVVMERSLVAEQEAELVEWEESLVERLEQEMMERLQERLKYIR